MKIHNESEEFISADLVRALFTYVPTTGEFFNRLTTGTKAKQGELAGYITDNNYVEVTILSRKYKAHRLAWLYTYGTFPAALLDHIDGDRLNNALYNLREATATQNLYNTPIRSDNTSRYKVVALDRRWNKFRAYINIEGKQQSLGYYDTAEEAGSAYVSAAKELHGEYFNENTTIR